MSQDALLPLLNGLNKASVLVVGDVMLDRFVYGSVERISPEAPIPVLRVERSVDMPGGAGNVVRNCEALGGRATLIGVVGDDAWAHELRRQFAASHAYLIEEPGRPTTLKMRYVAERQQVLRADAETRKPVASDVERQILDAFQAALPACDVVVLSDYAKGVFSDGLTQALISAARSADKQLLVDPKTRRLAKYAGASILTPNRQELQAACGHECSSDEEVAAGARMVLDEGVCEAVVVTRGPQGMTIVRKGEEPAHLPTTAHEVFDVSGAGDTVIATLALGLAAGGSLIDSAALANIAAGIVVSKQGTAVVRPGEIMLALEALDGDEPSKVFTTARLLHKVRQWRARGLKIAFTNGCFDLLHPGHISLLTQAKGASDRLIVGLNSDDSVRRLKGPGRPVQSESARATVLASLNCVDAVVIFSEDTPLELIKAVSPDVLVKGADYTLDAVVGAREVMERGGRVLLANLLDGHSTTDTLRRVAGGKEA